MMFSIFNPVWFSNGAILLILTFLFFFQPQINTNNLYLFGEKNTESKHLVISGKAMAQHKSQIKPKPKPKPKTKPKVIIQIPVKSVSYPVGCNYYLPIVDNYNWNISTAMKVMELESSCNPKRHNWGDRHRTCTGSYGLFQIGCVHGYSIAYLENPANNIAIAYRLHKAAGNWCDWTNTARKLGLGC